MARMGKTRICKKCGNIDVSLRYHKDDEKKRTITREDLPGIGGLEVSYQDEWLNVTCNVCGYFWQDDVLEKG
jgi:predicted nucleic-acid-binding Zn-ribbon protein